MKRALFTLLIAALFVGLTACGDGAETETTTIEEEAETQQAAGDAEVILQIGHVDVPQDDNHNQYFAVKFSEYVDELTDGRVEIQIMANSQLGAERDMMEGMQLGTVDMAIITNLAIGSFSAQYMVFDLPYLFEDEDMAFAVMDSDLAARIDDNLRDSTGIVVLGRGQGGFRHTINNSRPIKEVEDLEGIKIRVPENTLFLETFRALGANPTPMAWNETFTGMQQKTIDALECPTSVIYTTRFYEVAQYCSTTQHFFSPVVMMISGSVWDTLDDDLQSLIQEAAQLAAEDQRAFVSANELDLLEELEAQGMEVNTDVNIAAFKEACLPIYEEFRDEIGGDILDEALALTE